MSETRISFQCECGAKLHAPLHKQGARAKCPACLALIKVPNENDDLVRLDSLRDLSDQVGWKTGSSSRSASSSSVLRRCRHCDGYIAAGQTFCESCGLPSDTSTLLTRRVSEEIVQEEKRRHYQKIDRRRRQYLPPPKPRSSNNSSIWNAILAMFRKGNR